MSDIDMKVKLIVKTDTDTFELCNYLSALSSLSHIESHGNIPRERTVFNAPKKQHEKSNTYDAINQENISVFNPKLHRDDRRHDKHIGLDICTEEDAKPVPSKVSSDIGHHLKRICDPHERSHVRIQFLENQFFRRNGVNFENTSENQELKRFGVK